MHRIYRIEAEQDHPDHPAILSQIPFPLRHSVWGIGRDALPRVRADRQVGPTVALAARQLCRSPRSLMSLATCNLSRGLYPESVSKSKRVAEMVAQHQGRKLDAHYLGYFDYFNQRLFYGRRFVSGRRRRNSVGRDIALRCPRPHGAGERTSKVHAGSCARLGR